MKMQSARNNNRQIKDVVVRLLNRLKQSNTYWLIIFPLVFSLILLAGLLFIGNKLYNGKISEVYYSVSGAICLIIASLSGVVQVIKREGPGPFDQTIYGLWPVISGSILIFICWAIALALLAYAVNIERNVFLSWILLA